MEGEDRRPAQRVVTSAVQVIERREAIAELGLTSQEAQRLLRAPNLPSTSLEPFTQQRSEREELAWIGLLVSFTAVAFYCGFLLVGVWRRSRAWSSRCSSPACGPPSSSRADSGYPSRSVSRSSRSWPVDLIALRFSENTTSTKTTSTTVELSSG